MTAADDSGRQAQDRELARLPGSVEKRSVSQRLTALVRAERVANHIPERVAKAMEARR